MLRAVIDTSSLVSYVLTRGDLMRRVVAHWRANGFVVLSSPATRAELAAALSRPQIQRLNKNVRRRVGVIHTAP
jgi:predicted nucleic acid-binding protein